MAFTTLTTKDPADVVDYQITFAGRGMANDALATVTATATGVTVDSSSFVVPGVVTVWLSGGTAGTDGVLQLTCTTTGGRTIERSFAVPVANL
jgi:hypothetical protein